ncbi:MAG: tRNA (guanosine(37)-N1)-methyltransferase TrmD [Myxococcales bacterium]|nr:tRNA (guanosine(37)-N1)-methyltransferase TrmD [Myxococcales bacterium]
MSGPRIDILTIFPEIVQPFLEASVLGQARANGRIEIRVSDFRSYATDRHRSVDAPPYGGGDGMVLRCEPLVAAIEDVRRQSSRVLLLTPKGRRFSQELALELAEETHLVLVCGRYAGFDERIAEETGAEQLSIGDFVISGGEVAALVVSEAVARLVPGVLGNPESAAADSFSDGLLEHPLYTRPRDFRGRPVPEVLISGNHGEVDRWRHQQALRETRRHRPDLLRSTNLSDEDRAILRELESERDAGA